MKKRQIIGLLIIIFIVSNSFAQQTIAVIGFKARGIPANEVATLTDRFRNELVKTSKYIVTERGAMEDVLNELGFQQSGCVSTECAVEIGKTLGAEQIIAGSIGKVGGVYSVSVRIIEVESSIIIKGCDYDHEGDIGGLLTTGMRNAVNQLLEISDKVISQYRPRVETNFASSTTEEEMAGTVTDIDGNVYKTVKIGNQWWMAENLKVTHYRNGDKIPNVTDDADWSNLTNGAYCYYNYDVDNESVYGVLYNFFAVSDNRNIAPEGWHISTDTDWKKLTDYLGGENAAGDKMKEVGTSHWYVSNEGATNESGFTALPGGWRNIDGKFYWQYLYGFFWTPIEINYGVVHRRLHCNTHDVERYQSDMPVPHSRRGYSVRCVKD